VTIGDEAFLVGLVRLAARFAHLAREALGQQEEKRGRDEEGGIPMSTSRVIVDGQSFVWSVENTRWPVRAARTEI
jgi:hypothetical protein